MQADVLNAFEEVVERIEAETGRRPNRGLISPLLRRSLEKAVEARLAAGRGRTDISRLVGVPIDLDDRLPEGDARFLVEDHPPIQVHLVDEAAS